MKFDDRLPYGPSNWPKWLARSPWESAWKTEAHQARAQVRALRLRRGSFHCLTAQLSILFWFAFLFWFVFGGAESRHILIGMAQNVAHLGRDLFESLAGAIQ
jgi:threonine/homoserine/homoserine lactone efflux protein